ncbi:hypothetical protein Deipe_4352 (plasmid) [Deinococcus peraridilitoris DSM 19664]|uniref:Uncharacterized protein n=1 Tax=Deinococcus peraridilitoris (strain DSM 19664 / LMG 22246 / CIP 109416 / KR-200) TaxID=937777 RepID=L0A985_DEIPD|nr:hypothetical protein Deipe_4352 [Deinococcus peraridilitoris DSM 19664]
MLTKATERSLAGERNLRYAMTDEEVPLNGNGGPRRAVKRTGLVDAEVREFRLDPHAQNAREQR